MKKILLLSITLLTFSSLFGKEIDIEIPCSLLGRDYVIATRVEKMSQPVELGKMKVYPGLRVYNPQLVRFNVQGDSLVLMAEDAKRGPQSIAMPVISRSDDAVKVSMTHLFKSILRGTDVISGKMLTDRMMPEATKVSLVKGDARHLEVRVDYSYRTDSVPLNISIRKSLLLLDEKPMEGRAVDSRLGYKTTNGKHINRFCLKEQRKNIVFYVSDEFPTLWQKAIHDGVEDWNIAFSKMGMPNVMKAVRYSEAGSDFDPFDITNNCFYMVDSDFANAMGNHWTDPRSGEILQADVQFYNGVLGKLKSWMFLQTSAYNNDISSGTIPDEVAYRMLRYAAAHEIGHCLGLEHNYRASFAYPTDSLRNVEFCRNNGTTPSIMDYARFNYVAQPGDGVTDVYPPLLGDYDIYAIEAGYRDMTADAYKSFVDAHQQSPRYLYKKVSVSSLPNDEAVQQTDLGNDQLLSTRYGIKNIASMPSSALAQLKADEVHAYYFSLLMHVVPCLDRQDVKEFLEEQLQQGYLILNSDKMKQAYGDQSKEISRRRSEFINRVSKQYTLDITPDPLSTGVWMPHQMLSDDIFSLLRKDGLCLSKKQIYDINKRCASGAALSLSVDNGVSSPFATASFVSKDGLVMTNFHCVSSYVQALSKGQNDYMKYGCWAESREQESPLFNLEVHQLLSVEDITAKVFEGTDGMTPQERDDEAGKRAQRMMSSSGEPYGVSRKVYAMMGNQQFVLARYRTFKDIRIVACPPLWLGAYGGDKDNWTWPRYSCDFAFLRVYVTPEGESYEYSKDNVPFHPKSYLKVAKKSVEEGDLALVMGFPSQTRKYIPAYALDKIVNRDTQLRANALKAKIDFLRERSRTATGTALSGYEVRIGKLMNVYLRSKGEIEGVREMGLVDIKRREDLELQQWINADADRMARYGSNLIQKMDSVYSQVTLFNHMDEAFSQFVGSGAGIIPFAGKFEKLINISRSKRKTRDDDMKREIVEIQRNIREFFPSISMEEDCGMMKTLLPIYCKAVDKKYLPEAMRKPLDMDHLYATSLLTDSARLETLLNESIEKGMTALAEDSLYRICMDLYVNRVQKQNREATPLRRLNTKLFGVYMRAKMEKQAGEIVQYEANHTLRFSPGRVKEVGHVADMALRTDSLSPQFRRLLASGKDLPVACFTTSAETSAGNSGSAVIDARGNLIGLNFDRTLQSTASIYRFNPLTMGNIAVSMDYILWVIRNLSHSQYILSEIEEK